MLCCRRAVDGPFAVINADDFYGASSYRRLREFLQVPPDDASSSAPLLTGHCQLLTFCLVGFILRNTLSPHGHVARGICEVDGDMFLQRVVERTH